MRHHCDRFSAIIFLFSLALAACQSSPHSPAPVSEISTKTAPNKTATNTAPAKPTVEKQDKDWRPDSYTVKKGDTLYSIGLEHGFDYKEIAQLNQIDPPYIIKIGQSLKLKELKNANGTNKIPEKKNDDVVVTKPINPDSSAPKGKSLDEPISAKPLDSLETKQNQITPATQNEPTNTAQKTVPDINDKLAQQSRPTPVNNASTATTNAPTSSDWVWPAKGKVTNPFAEGGNAKGIDIEGTLGQDVNAAGSGKVIYNGGDLRGYGNMLIIKHDKDLLSVYAHNSKSLVKEGQMISKGQKIAEMGSSGTDKVKLHFEIRFQGKSVDPIKYLGSLPQ